MNMLIYLFLTDAEQWDAPDAKWSLFLSVRPLDGAGEHLPHGSHRLAEGEDIETVLTRGHARLHGAGLNVTGWDDFQANMTALTLKPDEAHFNAPGEGVYLVSEAIGKGIWDEVQAAHRRERKAAAALATQTPVEEEPMLIKDSPFLRPWGDPATASDNTITHNEPSLLERVLIAELDEPAPKASPPARKRRGVDSHHTKE